MAKKQTRRTFSVSRATYDAATEAAALAGVSCSEWVTELIRGACPGLRRQIHTSDPRPEPSDWKPAFRAALKERPRIHKMTPIQVRAALGIRPGALCANCVTHAATHRGRIDLTGQLYALCDDCELPDEKRSRPETPP